MGDVVSSIFFFIFHFTAVSPGLVFAWVQFRTGKIENPAAALVLGYAVGYAFEILILTLFMYLNFPVWIPSLIGVLSWTALLIGRKSGGRTAFSPGDNRVGYLFGLAGVLLTVIVLSRVGRIEDGYHIYTTLFVNDYFNHMAVPAALAKQVPPTNIYYNGPTAHYYWFFHIVPAAFHRLTGLNSDIRLILGILASCNIIMLFAALQQLLTASKVSRRAVNWTLALVFIGYSYMDLFIIGRAFGNMIGITDLIPATGKFWPKIEAFSGLSHSYVRDFFVEPHAVAATLLGIGTILVYLGALGKRSRLIDGALIGLLALTCFGCDSFMGTIVVLWLIVVNLLDLIRHRDWNGKLKLVAGVGIIAIAGYFFVFGLHMIGGQGGMLSFQPMLAVIATLPFYLALDYGPLFLFGLAGWWRVWRERLSFPTVHLWILAGIALLFGLFIRHAVEPDILLRKSGKPLQLALLVGAAVLLEKVLKKKGRGRKIVIVMLIFSAPTLLLDLQAFGGFFGSRGLENRIAATDYTALRWVRKNTEPNAVVQGTPGYPGDYLYDINPVPALAEQPVGVGTFMLAALWGVGNGPAIDRIKQVEEMFNADSILQVVPVLDSLNIGYLYLGPKETERYILRPELFTANDSLFEKVYDFDSVTILRYRGSTKH
ncbi:MAG TPA: hypothetical protein PLF13_12685 [candidate division Zixibacteria bacterium]|nr:hypothetical protein [candidate division Zixibacteria bacterium]